MFIEKLYIMHYQPLEDRKIYLDKIVPKIHSNYEFIVSNNETDQEIIDRFNEVYKYNPEILNRKIQFPELCASLAHIKVYEDMIKNDYKLCLVIEDDALITDDFFRKINDVVAYADKFDFIFLSTCCNLRSNLKTNELVHPSPYSRCMTGYLVNRRNLEKTIENLTPLSTNIDNQLNVIKNKAGLEYGWCEPPIIIQGSEVSYKSNLR